jgi:hypothetical protein
MVTFNPQESGYPLCMQCKCAKLWLDGRCSVFYSQEQAWNCALGLCPVQIKHE